MINLISNLTKKIKGFNRLRIAVLAITMVFAATTVAKPFYIEIAGGNNTGLPINIIGSGIDCNLLTNVIHKNLQNSGQFNVVEKSADHVLAINLQPMLNKPDLYSIEFKLKNTLTSNNTLLLNFWFKDIKPEKLRALAHHISDLTFEKLTGVKGFFSTKIAYITIERFGNQVIHALTVADADGYNDKQLVTANYPLMSPAWSPDGKRLAYVAFKNNRSAVNIVNLVDGKITHVSSFPGINGAPAWSPDGNSLALVLSKDGAPKIYVLDLITNQLAKITKGFSIDTEPRWEPGGKSILFTSNRGGNPQIYRVNLANKAVDRITFIGKYNATPSLTPDGKKLVMLHRSIDGSFNIAVQDLQTEKFKILTQARADESPTMAPNGMMVLYSTKYANKNILGAVTLDGKFKIRLPVQDGSVKEPAWSPFA